MPLDFDIRLDGPLARHARWRGRLARRQRLLGRRLRLQVPGQRPELAMLLMRPIGQERADVAADLVHAHRLAERAELQKRALQADLQLRGEDPNAIAEMF